MNNSTFRYFVLIISFSLLCIGYGSAQTRDTTKSANNDTTSKVRYQLKDNRLPYQTQGPIGLNLKEPSNLTKTIEFDPVSKQYVFKDKVGNLDYQVPYALDQKEYNQFDAKDSRKNYWVERRKIDRGQASSSFMPKINLGGEAFDKLFGSNTINIVPQGSAELIFGLNTQRTNNPNISERLRKTTTFDFQEKIQMNVTGSIGDKMKLGINYNTEATFDFENKTKLEYTGKEDEIIKKIEAGNVTLPLTGSLITGSQSLFGIKTELQFGKLTVTSVISQQKGESSVIDVKGGAQVSDFDIPIDQYDANKHFFLSQFFRSKYEKALENPPTINSGITITKIEVWVTNKNSNFTDARNIIAFLDLGDAVTWNKGQAFPIRAGANVSYPASNDANGLRDKYLREPGARDITNISNILLSSSYKGFYNGEDFEKIESARRLTDREFTLNAQLGYISLNAQLNANEVLAVAYEYTYYGKTYQVGELSTSNTDPKEALVVKLLKNSSFTPKLPNWDLMMKNVYAINAYQINPSNFQLNIVYQDDKNGAAVNYIPEDPTSKYILLEELKLDRLNSNRETRPDGVFDFMEGVTINSSNGRIYFPLLEPFGKSMDSFLTAKYKLKNLQVPESVRKKYVYSELYTLTQTNARQFAEKNKYRLKGTYQSAGGADIALNAMNVPQGSVVVMAGGRKLLENVDYTVDYTLGRVKIINPGLLESGTPIKISLESNSLFNFQTKTLLGTHLDYKFSDNFNLGATVMNLTERPLTTKVNIGDEPISNTIWGLNGTYTTKSQLLTTILDKIPFLDVKEPSTITIDGEFAQLIPGHSSAIGKSGSAYIDDFEGSETPIDMKTFQSWNLASTPTDLPEGSRRNDLSSGYNRAKLAWYQIDPLFLRNTSATPGNIKNNADIQNNPLVIEIFERDIFHNYDEVAGVPTNISVLNLAFYPKERGPYNYDTTKMFIDANGKFTNPEDRWGGIQREITQSDFETANIEFIEFWMMDPYVLDKDKVRKEPNAALYFNLGDVSEDVLKDSRKSFENGLPTGPGNDGVDSTVWGYVSKSQSLVNAFATTGRVYQDVGLDGLGDSSETRYFKKYLDALARIPGSVAYEKAKIDPSSDDFRYFRDGYYDAHNTDILGRYKDYNGMEANSQENNSASGESFSSTILPNTEDINHDNTLNEQENFYEYKVDLDPSRLRVGQNFVVDKVTQALTNPYTNKSTGKIIDSAYWYQFRIPIAEYQKIVGSQPDFKSIQFMRMFLKGFKDSIILRFARLNLVRGEWRKYNLTMRQGGESLSTPEETDASFDISSVNIEDNSSKSPVNYVLPPGVTRQTDPSNPQVRMLNEQSMVLRVKDLANGNAKAAYKNINFDIRQYKRLQMEVHAEELPGTTIADNELSVFIRIGSDYKNNFYEYEVPLKLTSAGHYSTNDDNQRLQVWPEENRMDIALEDFQTTKLARNDEIARQGSTLTSTTVVWPYQIPGNKGKYYICGNPNLSNIRTIMIGIRYPFDPNKSGQTRDIEVWVDELRVTDFNEKGGWAANLRVTSRLSDFGTLSVSGNTSTHGFGSIDQKINQRSKEDLYQYDIASNLELGKFFSQKSGIQIPMFVGFSETYIRPQYNPLDPDVELATSLKYLKSDAERKDLLSKVQDYTQRKSINFTNVRINKKEGKPHIYDISNWTINYGFNQTFNRNINIERNLQKRYQGGLMFTFQPKAKNIAPFQNWKIFRPNPLKLIRDFNFQLVPTNLSFRTDVNRNYNEVKLRNLNNPDFISKTSVNKDFMWNRYYDVGWDLTRSLKIDFSASNMARIDEPDGVVDRNDRQNYQNWKDTVWRNVLNGGRTTHYQHDFNVNYTIPINKLPLLEWTSANARYSATYDWNAGPINNLSLGNTINNSNNLQLTNQFNLNQLYNKVPYFRRITQPPVPKAQRQKKYKKVTYERDKIDLVANEPKSIFHGLAAKEVTAKILGSDGKEIKGKVDVVNENKITITVDKDYKGTKIVLDGKVEEKPNPIAIVMENFSRLVLGIKNINITWSRTQGTTLPGFMPKTKLLGMSNDADLNAPGLGFVFGVQDKNFAQKAIANRWLTGDTSINSPMILTYNERLTIRSTIEPFPGFRIELTATRNITKNENSYYSPGRNFLPGTFINSQQTGNFSMSFVAIGSAFQKLKQSDNYYSPVFETFKNNRYIVASRLGKNRQELVSSIAKNQPGISVDPYDPNVPNLDGGVNGYGFTSQDVLIPAFMAAYGGISPSKVTLDKFPAIWNMMPNWRINYDGLSKVGFLQGFAKTITLSHSYNATYNVGNYVSNGVYDDLESYLGIQRDMQNNFIPKYNISSVSITEQFGPLVGVDIMFVNSISAKLEIRKNRNILLSLGNNQLTETSSDELVTGAGYKIGDFKFFVKDLAGGKKSYKSDLNLRADVSIRDNKTILRRLTNEPDQPAQGQKVVTIKVSADYLISDKFTLRMFYDRIVNTPLVALSYPTATTNFGFSLRFSLAQ